MDQHFIKSIKRGIGYWLGLRAKDIVIIQFYKEAAPGDALPLQAGWQHCGCEWIHRPTSASGECVYVFREDKPQMPPAVVRVVHVGQWMTEIPPDGVLDVFAYEEEPT